MSHILLLGSASSSRQLLLTQACIPFKVIGHAACEDDIADQASLELTVQAIARYKMEHVILPAGQDGQIAFVLTADSMVADSAGKFHGKPKDRDDAITKLKIFAEGISITATGFCLERRMFIDGSWVTQERIEKTVAAACEFIVPAHWFDRYFEHTKAMCAAGATAVEAYGMLFLKSIRGSYSAVMGLPLFELRESLELIGFFE